MNCFTTRVRSVDVHATSKQASKAGKINLITASFIHHHRRCQPRIFPLHHSPLPPVPPIVHPPAIDPSVRQRFDKFIQGRGLRRTPQRDAILRCVFSGHEHFTAEELWDRVRRTNNRSSRATVYRTLSLLVDAGLLREIDLGGEQTTYDPNFLDRPSHNHLVCVDCGQVVEFEDSHVEVLNDCLTRRLGFQPVRQSLRIEACCEKLRSSGTCPNLIQARIEGKRLPTRRR